MSIGDDKILEDLISQYKEKIENALTDCEHVYRLTIDYEMLDQKISELIICAETDGLTNKIFWNLVQSQVPSYINYVNSKAYSKKAA